MFGQATHNPACDALVLVLHRDSSLEVLDRAGLLGREWALYRRLFNQGVPHLTIVSPGGPAEPAILARQAAPLAPALVHNPANLGEHDFAAEAAARVHATLPTTARRVIIKTNQHRAGDLALDIALGLRAKGLDAPLIARGGYPYSQFAARDFGPASVGAIQAAELEARLFRAADHIVGTTAEMLADLAWRHHLDPARLALIPNYVDTDALPPPVPRDPRVVLFAGRLEPQKRVDLLIEALASPTLRTLGVTLSIIGEGTAEPALRDLASRLGIDARFEPRLPHHQLLERMRRCAVYAQASAFEGHPKTVLEAMACAAPVVVCDVPGMRGVVAPNSTGLLVAHDRAAIADAIATLLNDPARAAALGLAAADSIERTCSLSRVVELELGLYRAALDSTRRALAPTARAAVRWEPSLIERPPAEAADAWSRSLAAFISRLAEPARAQFLRNLRDTLDAPPPPREPRLSSRDKKDRENDQSPRTPTPMHPA